MSAADLVERARAHGVSIAVAESCTGGLLGGAITAVPGASQVFRGGIIAYDDDMKHKLGVSAKTLAKNGAVSAATVEALAHGVREWADVDLAVAVSGVAGPDGGTLRKPVGLVWIAILGPEHLLNVHKCKFTGDREAIRAQAVEHCLRLALENLDEAVAENLR